MLDFIGATSDPSFPRCIRSSSRYSALLGLTVPKGGVLNSKLLSLTLALTWAFRRQKVTHLKGFFLPRGRAAVSLDPISIYDRVTLVADGWMHGLGII
jgi:hypothetical protein